MNIVRLDNDVVVLIDTEGLAYVRSDIISQIWPPGKLRNAVQVKIKKDAARGNAATRKILIDRWTWYLPLISFRNDLSSRCHRDGHDYLNDFDFDSLYANIREARIGHAINSRESCRDRIEKLQDEIEFWEDYEMQLHEPVEWDRPN